MTEGGHMQVHNDVKRAFSMLHQDVLSDVHSMEELAEEVMRGLTDEVRPLLREFLSSLLDGTHTRGEIRAAFEKTHSEIRFDKTDELIEFLGVLNDRLRA